MVVAERQRLTAVARGARPADLYVRGFADGLDGLASTITTDFNILVLGGVGRRWRAPNRLLDLRGGVVIVDGVDVACEMSLPLGGIMARADLPLAAASEDRVRQALAAHGHRFHDPFFSMLFMAADFLPTVRLTPRGVWDVKRRRVLLSRRARR